VETGTGVALMARRLIVNADGFGFGGGATQGILDALREGGFISSISVNANFPDVERLRELVSEFPDVSVGVHLNPLAGQPCLPAAKVPSLVDADGFFFNAKFMQRLRRGKIVLAELEAEFDAQIARVKMLAGDQVTHLDSQANSHLSYFPLFLKLAKKWNLQRMRNNASLICLESPSPRSSRVKAYARKPHVWLMHGYRKWQMRRAQAAGMRMADMLITVGYAGTGNKSEYENWKRILSNLPDGTYEIYCHPAYPDDTLKRWSYYYDERKRELDILRQKRLRQLATNLGIQLVPFQAL
jgi:predicted glycoside hydrolase/deacetylase ChbG (UPF0249 family)